MDVEMEPFEITDWDLQNEFSRPRMKRPSKKKQLYGIWADDDSDEDEDNYNRPSFGSDGREKRDFTAPINFISGGFKQPAQKKEAEEENKNSTDEEEERETVRKTRRDFNRSYRHATRGGFGGTRFAGVKEEADKGFGSWEKHTRGIGQKLLLQMGYKPGKGLGKDQQGIVAPIEAKKREGKGALGLYGPEHLPKKPTVVPEEADNATQLKKEGLHHWKKKLGEEPQVKYVYKTVEEVKSEGAHKRPSGGLSSLSSVKVIDMTGPEQRIFSGYHQIHQQHSKPLDSECEKSSQGNHFSLPELEHNLELLVKMTEQAIIRNDREFRCCQDRVVTLQHQEEQTENVLQQEETQIDQIKDILKLIESLEESKEDPLANIMEAASIFKRLQNDFYEEYRMFELSDLAITIVFPLATLYLKEWNPLQNPTYGLDIFKTWKDILEEGNVDASLDPYHQLVWDVWMPSVRKSVLSWTVRQPDKLIEFLENWLPLLPSWILENILMQLVLPCLEREVTEWNPVMDTVPIHAWLHPWLPLMGDRLESLYPPIRHKLAAALTNWHPGDCSAKLILEPWRSVFSRGTMEAFVVTNILPKLALAMQGFVVNPHQQHLDIWHWVMAWEDLLPLASLVSMLENTFFPKWLQVLCGWLTHNPNYEEVTKWYMGWKSMFSDSLKTHPIVRDNFKKALDIMNHAVTNPQAPLSYQPGARESLAYLSNMERQQDGQTEKNKWDFQAVSQAIRGAANTASLSMSFKDLIEKKAEELGILFAPIPNRYQEGKQVYRFGKWTMYLDRGVIFVFNDKAWVPTSLQTILDMAA